MKYIQRSESGDVIGVYANRQPGFAEEEVPDDYVAPKTQAQLNAEIQAQIEAIERKELLCRSVREQLLENTERANPSKSQAEIYASNPRYKNIKDVDDQIAALRAQIV